MPTNQKLSTYSVSGRRSFVDFNGFSQVKFVDHVMCLAAAEVNHIVSTSVKPNILMCIFLSSVFVTLSCVFVRVSPGDGIEKGNRETINTDSVHSFVRQQCVQYRTKHPQGSSWVCDDLSESRQGLTLNKILNKGPPWLQL